MQEKKEKIYFLFICFTRPDRVVLEFLVWLQTKPKILVWPKKQPKNKTKAKKTY